MKKIIITISLIILSFQITNWYKFQWKDYNIYYPENIEALENDFWNQKITKDHKYYKLIFLNQLLIEKGDPSIW